MKKIKVMNGVYNIINIYEKDSPLKWLGLFIIATGGPGLGLPGLPTAKLERVLGMPALSYKRPLSTSNRASVTEGMDGMVTGPVPADTHAGPVVSF